MSQDAVLAQLLAIRAQVDAAIALVSGGNDEGCTHPVDDRVDLTEMGGPIRYLCRACGQEITLTEGEDDHEGA